MTTKHTPGPWRACHESKCPCRQVWSLPGDFPVFTAKAPGEAQSIVGMAHHKMADAPDLIYGEIPEWQTEANARLIAAAPEMLDLLERIVTVYERIGGPLAADATLNDARAILARIRGAA
jgi:hypothetical protein